jgi:hypothetical protein
VLGERSVVVAEGARDPPQHLVDRRRDLGVLALSETADRGFEIGQRSIRAPRGERHLGRLVEQLAIDGPRAAGGAELERQLAGSQRVARRIELLRDGRGRQRRCPGPRRLVRRQPVAERRRRIRAE